jgi:pimeloyl-ACP methyl ester carboxylesterase
MDSRYHRRPSWVARRTCARLPPDPGRHGHDPSPLARTDRAPRRILLGHSTGAQAALKTAQLTPELIRGLVLAGPTLHPDARTMPALLKRAIQTLPHEVPAQLPAVIPSYIASGGRPMLRLIRSAMADRPEHQVRQRTMPSVVITGRHDGFAPPA